MATLKICTAAWDQFTFKIFTCKHIIWDLLVTLYSLCLLWCSSPLNSKFSPSNISTVCCWGQVCQQTPCAVCLFDHAEPKTLHPNEMRLASGSVLAQALSPTAHQHLSQSRVVLPSSHATVSILHYTPTCHMLDWPGSYPGCPLHD